MEIQQMPESVFGITTWSQLPESPETPKSMFGPGTVRVQIKYCSSNKMLKYLVHELAHLKYQVPNLAVYARYYKETYNGNHVNTHLGHQCDDPSNVLVQQELRKFDLVSKKRRQMGTRQYMANAKK
jgi:hypothetical protein